MQRYSVAQFLVALIIATSFAGLSLSGCHPSEKIDQSQEAETYLAAHPNADPTIAAALKAGVVVVGMTPDEAHIAGGAGPYHVKADPKWPKGTDPLRILAAQTSSPDDSVIELYFFNARQYHTAEAVHFTAHFERGRVIRIERH